MSTFVFPNNVKTTLANPITSTTATTCTLSSSTNLPTLSAGQIFAITFNDVATGNVYEICYCTARTGAVLTIVRGQDGTSAQTWLATDLAYCSVTAGILDSFTQDTPGATPLDTSATAQTKAGALTMFSAAFTGVGSASVPWVGTDGPTNGMQLNVPTGTTNGFRFIVANSTIDAQLLNAEFQAGNLIATYDVSAFSMPNIFDTGDILAQRSASSGAIVMGGASLSGTIDYGATTAGYMTINQPLNILGSGATPVSGLSEGDLNLTRGGNSTGVLYQGGSAGAGYLDYGVTTTAQFSFNQVAGGYATINATAFTTHSDISAKRDIAASPYSLDAIMKLKPSRYVLKSTGESFLGFIAQDVAEVIPEAVRKNNDGQMLLHMDSIFTALVASVQEQKRDFDAYKLTHP